MSSEAPSSPGISQVCQKPYGGKISENEERYSEHFKSSDGRDDESDYRERNESATNIASTYYTLVTDFYEYGYGPSFHFAPVQDGKSHSECMREFEEEIGRSLNAGPGTKILDIGCGVGGPARTIAKSSGASVTGLNICDYQLGRAKVHTDKAGLQDLITFVKGDFTKMDFPDNTFDGVYAMEATCHAKQPVDVYSEVYRVLKPGALFVDSAWAMTDLYDPSNPTHVKIKKEIEYGNGVPEMKTMKEILEGLKEAGLELVGFRNCHHEGDKPWYVVFAGESVCSIEHFRASPVGRWTTHFVLSVLETIRIVPEGSTKVHGLLLTAARGLTAGGKADIFTPMFRIVARKPL